MNPIIIKRLDFEAATLLKGGEFDPRALDVDLVVNRMLAISKSRISSFFYGMQDSFERLAEACGASPSALARKSFGEVASGISLDDVAFILAFIEPLTHLSFAIGQQAPYIEAHAWKKVRYDAAPRADGPLERISLDEPHDDYFEAHLGKRPTSPERAMFLSFRFDAKAYVKAVSIVSGQDGVLDELLAPFETSTSSLLPLVRDLGEACGADPLNLSFVIEHGACFDSDLSSYPDPEASAIKALYLLFVKPYALIYSNHEPLERFISSINADRLESVCS